jgi:hypothetical protein
MVAYWVCICQATLISLISLGHKIHSSFHQFRERLKAARNLCIEAEPTRQQILQEKIVAAKATCLSHVLAVLVATFEARPSKQPASSPSPPAACTPSSLCPVACGMPHTGAYLSYFCSNQHHFMFTHRCFPRTCRWVC